MNGGEIVADGPPEVVVQESKSFTGQYLRPLLERASVKPEVVEGKLPKASKRKMEYIAG